MKKYFGIVMILALLAGAATARAEERTNKPLVDAKQRQEQLKEKANQMKAAREQAMKKNVQF